jgi:eukaryotic-like serine/threonine-protein kinase
VSADRRDRVEQVKIRARSTHFAAKGDDRSFDPMAERRDPAADNLTEHGEAKPERYVEGQVISGKYALTRVIGRGGMGAVWLARNTVLDVDVAIKLIRRNAGTAEASSRLLQEARAAAKLGHESIVRVFDFGESELGDPFIVMEVLDGASLRTVIHDRGRLEAEEAVRTLLPIASALAAAHEKGIVHRDLKPDNVVLVADGRKRVPKVVDFGIAKLRVDDVERHVTQAGTVLGSPDYMSPEQALGKLDVDERVDVWALAVMLYETLTGSRPFDGPNYNALIAAITKDTPPSILDYGAGDAALAAIVERGLAKEPDARWPTMHDFGHALAEWAIAKGCTTDVTGTSLETEWLGDGAAPRSLPGGSSGRGAVATTTGRRAPAVWEPTTSRPLTNGVSSAPSRAPWIAGLGVVAAIGVGAWFVRGRTLAEPAASAPASAPPIASVALQATAPSADRAASAASASSADEPSARAPAFATGGPPRPRPLPGGKPARPAPSAKPSATSTDRVKPTPDVGF